MVRARRCRRWTPCDAGSRERRRARSSATGCWGSRVAEASGLVEHFTEPAVPHAHREAEPATAEIDVLDMSRAGRQPVEQPDAHSTELEVIGVAHEVQDAVARVHVESHA